MTDMDCQHWGNEYSNNLDCAARFDRFCHSLLDNFSMGFRWDLLDD